MFPGALSHTKQVRKLQTAGHRLCAQVFNLELQTWGDTWEVPRPYAAPRRQHLGDMSSQLLAADG